MRLKSNLSNKSSLNFRQFSESQLDPQKNRIYVCRSNVEDAMKDEVKPIRTKQRVIENRIYGSAQKLNIPICEMVQLDKEENQSYLSFFSSKQKFVKPYGEHAKYTDMMSKNQLLLRRGQFSKPIRQQREGDLEKKGKLIRIAKYSRHTTQVSRNELQNTEEIKMSPLKKSMFDKSISTQFSLYKKLLSIDRSTKKQQIRLSNSLSRLLAVQTIETITRCQPRKHTLEV